MEDNKNKDRRPASCYYRRYYYRLDYCDYRESINRLSKGIFKGIRRLKPNKIGFFDGLDKLSAVSYYKRIAYLSSTYSETLVLATLPLYIKGDAVA